MNWDGTQHVIGYRVEDLGLAKGCSASQALLVLVLVLDAIALP